MPLTKYRSVVKAPQQLCRDFFSLMELHWLSRRSDLERLCFPAVSQFLQRKIGMILTFCNVCPSTKYGGTCVLTPQGNRRAEWSSVLEAVASLLTIQEQRFVSLFRHIWNGHCFHHSFQQFAGYYRPTTSVISNAYTFRTRSAFIQVRLHSAGIFGIALQNIPQIFDCEPLYILQRQNFLVFIF